MAPFVSEIHDQGRDDLNAATLNERRGLFLSSALQALESPPRKMRCGERGRFISSGAAAVAWFQIGGPAVWSTRASCRRA
jgi:hypothetical protein